MESVSWPSIEHATFEAAVDEAIEKQLPLLIASNTVIQLTERILHKKNGATLRVIGSNDGDEDCRPLIISSGHSVFQVGGRGATLIIENLRMQHTCYEEHHKDIGGVVFALYRAKVDVVNCDLHSEHGFGVWAVQTASVKLTHCRVCSISRSGCVSFGRSSLTMDGCTVHDCFIHGVCSRGATVINLKSCTIVSSGTRGVYAYHNVTLNMTDCNISDTRSIDHAALDLWGCSLESSCRDTDPGSTLESDAIETDTISITRNIAATAAALSTFISTAVATDNASDCSDEFDSADNTMTAAIVVDKDGNFTEVLPTAGINSILSSGHLTPSDKSNEISINSIEDVTKTTQTINYEDFTDYSYTFPGAKKTADDLNVTLLRCVISDNRGLGLRIKYGSNGSRITGSILNCNLYGNDAGNVMKILSHGNGVKGNGMKGNGVTKEKGDISGNRGNNGKIDMESNQGNQLDNMCIHMEQHDQNTERPECLYSCRERPVVIWEFERDDPSASNDTHTTDSNSDNNTNLSTTNNANSNSIGTSVVYPDSSSAPLGPLGSWQAYDPASSAFIQSAHIKYIQEKLNSAYVSHQKVPPTTSYVTVPIISAIVMSVRNNDSDSDDDLECRDAIVTLPSPLCRYEINFKYMQQTNTDTHYMRSVRRREIFSASYAQSQLNAIIQ